ISPGRDGDIFEYTIASQTLVNLTNDWDYLEDDPTYSPDALNIVYTKNYYDMKKISIKYMIL
ncbi:MAG: hypothetical protein WCG45_02440, partial [bacterium]